MISEEIKKRQDPRYITESDRKLFEAIKERWADELTINYIIAAFYISVMALVVIYYAWFGIENDQILSTDATTWGVFGDFFGGVLNPIVAIVTLTWVVKAVNLQKQELKSTSDALKDSASAQLQTAELQRKGAIITAITGELHSVQSDIDHIRSRMLGLISLEWENPRAYSVYKHQIEHMDPQLSELVAKRESLLEVMHRLTRGKHAKKENAAEKSESIFSNPS